MPSQVRNKLRPGDYKHQASLKSDLALVHLPSEKQGFGFKKLCHKPCQWQRNLFGLPSKLGTKAAGYLLMTNVIRRYKQFGLPTVEVLEGGNVEEAPTQKMVFTSIPDFLKYSQQRRSDSKSWLAGRSRLWSREKLPTVFVTGSFSRQRYWGEPIPIIHRCHFEPRK